MEQENLPQKKFINSKEKVVTEALEGFCMTNPSLAILKDKQTIVLKKRVQDQVTLLCGGGSGHEPAHGGFVDPKILHAAVCGGVFASPSYQQVLGAIEHIAEKEGVLVIIKNYTGDVINFELASGFARTKGINVKTLVVGDDIAFVKDKNDTEKISEARGLSGTVLLYKILGAAASLGKNLDYLHDFGNKILKNMFTLGVSLSSCSIPGFPSTFQLGDEEMEVGLGIHGEKGKGRQKQTDVKTLVNQMLSENFYKFINENDKVVVLVNNLGATTDLEMAIIQREVLLQLNQKKVQTIRICSGRIMTSLEMHGVLLTIFKLENDWQEEALSYIDLQVNTNNWTCFTPELNVENTVLEPASASSETFFTKEKKTLNEQGEQFKALIKNIFTELQAKEGYFNELDSIVGDGDTGSGLARAANAVLENLDYLQFDTQFSKSTVALGEIISNAFAGTSGPLYGNFLSQASRFLKDNISENDSTNFSKAFSAGVEGVQSLGKAELNQRTMYDVLYPVAVEFLKISEQGSQSSKQIIDILCKKAQEQAEAVKQLPAKKGRARYLGGKEIGQKDPGCELVVEWLNLIQKQL